MLNECAFWMKNHEGLHFLFFQALQLGQDANSPYGLYNGQRCQMCLRSDSLHKIMERLAIPGTRFFFFSHMVKMLLMMNHSNHHSLKSSAIIVNCFRRKESLDCGGWEQACRRDNLIE